MPQIERTKIMKYNALLSEFTMVFNQPYDLFGENQNEFQRDASFLGLILRREDPDTQEMNISFVADCLEEYVRRMIGACACRVSIPAHGPKMWAAPNRIKSLLTPTNRKRIQFVDRKQAIWADLQAYLHPVFGDLPPEERKRGEPKPLRDLLGNLAWDLYIITLASRHNCEAVLSPTEAIDRIDTLIRSDLLSPESKSRLSVVRGLFALYSDSQNVPGFRCIAKAPQTSLRERLDEILEDAYLLEASYLRRFLGFKANTKAIKRDLRKLNKFIVKNRPWAKGILTAATQTAVLPAVPREAAGAILEAISNTGCGFSAPLLIDPIAYRQHTGARLIVSYRGAPFTGNDRGSLTIQWSGI